MTVGGIFAGAANTALNYALIFGDAGFRAKGVKLDAEAVRMKEKGDFYHG